MKNKTIIILKDICGEYGEDTEFIVGVYIVDKPDFDLQKEFVKYLKKFYEDNGLEAVIMGSKEEPYVCLRYLLYEYRKEYKGKVVENNRKLRELQKNNKGLDKIQYYVENVLKLERLDNVREIYIN